MTEVDYTDNTPYRDYAQTALPPKPTKGWLDFNLGPLTKAFRYASGGSTEDGKGIAGAPIIGTGLVGLGLGALGYHVGPWLDRIMRRVVSPKFRGQADDEDDYEDPETIRDSRRFWAGLLGGGGALLTAGLNFNTKRPWYGFKYYSPMYKPASALPKKAAAWDDMTIGQGMQLLHENNSLSPEMKLQSMQLLNSFNAPPNTPINGGTLVGQAIATGQSAMAGAAVGYLTASVLGLPNPTSTAILGAVANTLGPSSALAASMVFGH